MRGLSKTDPALFSIYVESMEIALDEGISFYEAFDYLIKSFYIFNFDFPSQIELVYTFIINYIYEIQYKATSPESIIDEKNFALKMKDLRDKINVALADIDVN